MLIPGLPEIRKMFILKRRLCAFGCRTVQVRAPTAWHSIVFGSVVAPQNTLREKTVAHKELYPVLDQCTNIRQIFVLYIAAKERDMQTK